VPTEPAWSKKSVQIRGSFRWTLARLACCAASHAETPEKDKDSGCAMPLPSHVWLQVHRLDVWADNSGERGQRVETASCRGCASPLLDLKSLLDLESLSRDLISKIMVHHLCEVPL